MDLIKICKNHGERTVILCDETIAPIIGHKIEKHLKDHQISTFMIQFKGGEQAKSRSTKAYIEDEMQKLGVTKQDCILAIGGGVTLDLSGFIAGTYQRGMKWIAFPTTLLAMVDASIGGKTGINTQYGKNQIGLIYAPSATFLDFDVLDTLPEKEMIEGLVEMFKHAILFDEKEFHYLLDRIDAFLHKDKKILEKAILKSRKFKEDIVMEDPHDQNIRHVINFGHTLGHGFEVMSDYKMSHGYAVAWGMYYETLLAKEKGICRKEDCEWIRKMIEKLKIYPEFKIDFPKLKKALLFDKKVLQGILYYVPVQKIGQYHPNILEPLDIDQLRCLLQRSQKSPSIN